MNLNFQEATRGVNKDISVNVVDTCPKCQGSRCELGTKAVRCPYCNGTGMVMFHRLLLFFLTLCFLSTVNVESPGLLISNIVQSREVFRFQGFQTVTDYPNWAMRCGLESITLFLPPVDLV